MAQDSNPFEYTQIVAAGVKNLLFQMVEQGLPQSRVARTQECADKLYSLIAEYHDDGLLAMGCVGETITQLLDE